MKGTNCDTSSPIHWVWIASGMRPGMARRRSNPASESPGLRSLETLFCAAYLPASMSHQARGPQARPSPQNMLVRCRPSSSQGRGRASTRAPQNSGCRTSWRDPSIRPSSVVSRQGPIQRSQRDSNGTDSARSIEIAGIGRALLERIRLFCEPGPHQRSIRFWLNNQLPTCSVSSEPSSRSGCRSAASVTPVRTSVADQFSSPVPAQMLRLPSSRPDVSKSRSSPGCPPTARTPPDSFVPATRARTRSTSAPKADPSRSRAPASARTTSARGSGQVVTDRSITPPSISSCRSLRSRPSPAGR
ncbi:MAG: hypothetical protein U1F06_01360 [Steroidobacteraceae bacterium]